MFDFNFTNGLFNVACAVADGLSQQVLSMQIVEQHVLNIWLVLLSALNQMI